MKSDGNQAETTEAEQGETAAQWVAQGLSFKRKVGTRQQAKRVVRAFKPKPRSKPTPPVEQKRPGAGYRLRFGKHNGERLDTIPEGYLEWLVGTADAAIGGARQTAATNN